MPSAPIVALVLDTGASASDYITSNKDLDITGLVPGAVVEYSIDAGDTWSAAFTAVEGLNDLQVRQIDTDQNASDPTSFSFTWDTTLPEVISITPSKTLLTDADATTDFTLTVVYSETMDTSVEPSLTFPEADLNETFITSRGGWFGTTTYVRSYAVFDSNVEISDIAVQVTGGRDLAGNGQTQEDAAQVFSIDMHGPSVTIALADGQPKVTTDPTIAFTVEFSEEVTGFGPDGVYVYSGQTVPPTVEVTGSGTTYNVVVSGLTLTGTVYASVNAGAVVDADGNGNQYCTSSASALFTTDSIAVSDDGFVFGVTNAYAQSIATDADGNIYVAGRAWGMVDFDPSSSVSCVDLGNIEEAAFVAEYSPNGELLWAKTFPAVEEDDYAASSISNIFIDASGIYAAGSFQGTMTFGTGDDAFSIESVRPAGFYSSENAFILKLDAQGTPLWATALTLAEDQGSEQPYSYHYISVSGLAVDSEGNIYSAGAFRGTVDFDPAEDVEFCVANSNSNNTDAYVWKLDSNGDLAWVATTFNNDAASRSFATSLAIDSASNVYVLGAFNGNVDVDPSPDNAYNLESGGEGNCQDSYLWKLDADGGLVGAVNTYSVIVETESSTLYGGCSLGAVLVDSADNVYVAGYYNGTVTFNVDDSLTTSGTDSVVAQLDSDCNILWVASTTSMASTDPDRAGWGSSTAASLAVDAAGSVFVVGSYNGRVDFDTDPEAALALEAPSESGYVWKLGQNGDFVWVETTVSADEDIYGVVYPCDIVVDSLGGVYSTGYVSGSLDFSSGAGDLLLDTGSTSTFVWNIDSIATRTSLSAATVAEGQAIGTSVGEFSTVGEGTGYTYALISGNGDDDNASFTLDGSQLLTAEVFDASVKSHYTIRVRTTDGDGEFIENVFEITVLGNGPIVSDVDVGTVDTTTTITWNVADADGIESVVLTVDQNVVGASKTSGDEFDADYSASVADLTVGNHLLTITTADVDGNTTIYSRDFTIAASDSKPLISGAFVALERAVPVITWAVSDADGIASATMTIDGAAKTVYGPYGTAFDALYAGSIGSLAVGSHTFVITATDVDGNTSTYTNSFEIAAAASDPVISGVIVATDRAMPVVTWAVADADGIASAKMTIDGATKTVYGPYGTAFDALYAGAIGNLDVGSHTFVITATDVDGNTSTYTNSFEIAAAPSDPVISGVIVATDRAMPVVTWAVADADGIASATMTIDGATKTVYGPYGTAFDALYSGAIGSLAVGSHTFVITATDVDGNTSTYTDSFEIAAAPSDPVISGVIVATDRAMPVVTWAVADADGIASAKMTVDGATKTVYGPYGTAFDAVYAGSIGKLAVGSHTFVITATDVDGNTSTYTDSFEIAASASNPVISGVFVAMDREVPVITWAVADVDGVASAKMTIDGAAKTVYGPYGTAFSALYSGQVGSPDEGEHTFVITATDVDGNVGTYTATFVIDTTAPVAPSVALANDTGNSETDGITSDGVLAPGNVEANAIVEYSVDGGAAWATTFTAVEGLNDVQVRQTDAAGNVSDAASFSFTLDTTPPTVTIEQAVGQSDPVGETPISFTATFSESVTSFSAADVLLSESTASGSLTVVVTPVGDDGTVYTVGVGNVVGSGSVVASVVADGAADAAGNGNGASTSEDNSVAYDATLDVYEPDNDATQANVIATDGTPQTHRIIPASDHDWVTFTLTATSDVILETNGIDGDTVMSLYGPDSSETLVASDDDSGEGLFSSITQVGSDALTPGTYFVRIVEFGENDSIDQYTLTVTATVVAPGVALVSDTGASDSDRITSVGDLALTRAADNVTVEYSINGGTTWTPTFTAVEGVNNVQVRQTDIEGHVSAATDFSFTLDTNIVPVGVALANDTGISNEDGITSDPAPDLTNVEDGATVEISIDDGSTWKSSFTAVEGYNEVWIRQTDLAGNVSAPRQAAFVLDTTPPTVTVNQAVDQADPTDATPIYFTVIFSEPVFGFDADGVDLGESTAAGTLVAEVTANDAGGASYTVAVTGMTDGDVVVVNVLAGAASDTAGNSSAASTSDDNQVAFAVIGELNAAPMVEWLLDVDDVTKTDSVRSVDAVFAEYA